MIQNFNVQGGPKFGRDNLPKLRAVLTQMDLDGLLVPHEDEYQNEYLPDSNERLMWVSGFTGSAGAAVVMTDRAIMFVDGRYTLQVRAQTDDSLFTYESLEGGGVATWLVNNVTAGQRIGYDPRLHSPDALDKLRKAIEGAGGALVALDENPIDAAWDDRPPVPMVQITVQPMKFAGISHHDKRAQIAQSLKKAKADAALITAPASVAWLLNIRGGDVMCSPLPLSSAVIYDDGKVDFYVHAQKVNDAVRAHLGNEVALREEDALPDGLAELSGKTVWIDPSTASAFMFDTLGKAGAKIHRAMDPVMLPKAQKNEAEIAGTTQTHLRDGVALARFLHWLATEAQNGEQDEISAAQKLEEFRSLYKGLKDLSFETISGAGPNGAFPHYRVNTDSNLKLERGSLFLIDSGGQYPDGTTDVTRTVAIGSPSADMIQHFTLVLKGHIALAAIRFPEGTSGHQLDALARMSLWNAGLDYDHGTGHGVGVYLGVHEGPQRISKGPNAIALKPGMIVSNEPGFYKSGGYGIRIENLQYVHAPKPIKGGERDMLGFINLTFAPIDRTLVDVDLLSPAERDWLNAYHAEVFEKISPNVPDDVAEWLKEVCAPI
ncbi:aminopeptidase P family protein [Robiginitomaculum antarcticum]|uniref:aminopeptidase P family protein n=1 Tax=Robiginitomaculum antarcticum TaxID=437507 RepID=UPI000364BE60|nr:aminopeptidase P family protein [Robiginitomaculum antarcticum]